MFESAKIKEKIENYKIMEEFGYYRPTSNERKYIKKEFYEYEKKEIFGRGYDLVANSIKPYIKERALGIIIEDVELFELKTTWQPIYDFKFTFGVTENEINNFRQLGNRFKIIFLNAHIKKIRVENFCEISKYFTHASYFFAVDGGRRPLNLESFGMV